MNNKKKGFTLIELLAAIVILGVIMTISGVVIMNAIKSSREKSYKVTVSEIESNANNYLTENKDRLFFLTDPVNNYEYQCVTVQNLVDYGYLKDTISNSRVDDSTNVNKKDYIYIIRNIKTKAIEKTIYVPKNNIEMGNTCARAILAQGDIAFTVIPNDDKWYQSKDVVINYRVKNVNDFSTLYEYEYNYMYYGNSEIKNNGGSTKTVKVTSNGIMTANIMYGDTEITTGSIEIGNIDTIKPVIEENYKETEIVRKTVDIPLLFTDEGGSKPNYGTFTKDDLVVTIGGEPITNFELKHGTNDNYTLTINDLEHAGAVIITINENKVEDNAKNVNDKIVLEPNISFSNTYTITYNANGGSDAPAAQTYTYASSGDITLSSIIPTRAGHKFNGWATTPDGVVAYTSGGNYPRNITNDVTLYAVWQEEGYTVTIDFNVDAEVYTSSASIREMWVSGGGTSKKYVYYSGGEKINGAKLFGTSVQKVKDNDILSFIPLKWYISANGYKFVGWYTNKEGTGMNYTNKTVFSAGTNITLYGIWKEKTVTGDYDIEGDRVVEPCTSGYCSCNPGGCSGMFYYN